MAEPGRRVGHGATVGAPSGFVPDTFWHLDSPRTGRPWASPDRLDVSGWTASRAPVEDLRLTVDGRPAGVELESAARPDVTDSFGLPATGFGASLPAAGAEGRDVQVEFSVDGVPHRIVVPSTEDVADPGERRLDKHRRLRPHLRCIACGGELEDGDDVLGCVACGERYPVVGGVFDFLPPAVREEFDIVPTENVSSNVYDGVMTNLVHAHRDGLVLDCGAGRQATYYRNVVNVEVVAYDTTDVLSVGERLPFADDTFDCVASFAVLEHVKDPFRCARELLRVLKPGGELYCQVPFLQPVHAYPNHFYNMTEQGLVNLFPGLDVEAAGVIPFGQPIFALSWILGSYAAGLPDDERARFESMTVAELMSPPSSQLGASHVVSLSQAARSELACTNFVYGRATG